MRNKTYELNIELKIVDCQYQLFKLKNRKMYMKKLYLDQFI